MPHNLSFSDSEGQSLPPRLEEELGFSPVSPMSDVSFGEAEYPKDNIIVEQVNHSPTPKDTPASVHQPVPSRSTESSNRARLVIKTEHLVPRPMSMLPTPMTPIDCFRAAVTKVVTQRTKGSPGSEPGVNPRHISAERDFGHIRRRCLIDIVDYSGVTMNSEQISNADFIRVLERPREPWVKVRWINIGGISWDVISAMAKRYEMHPLAVETVLGERGHARSKAHYYPEHFFLPVLRHSLSQEGINPLEVRPMEEVDLEDEMEQDDENPEHGSTGFTLLRNYVRRKLGPLGDVETSVCDHHKQTGPGLDKKKQKNAKNERLIRVLKGEKRVNVDISPMCIFLFRDGTVITIHKDTKLEFTAPILARLRQQRTRLRTTADPSLLVASLLGLIVDQALEVVEEFQSKILSLERHILVKPTMASVRRLHILQGDLILHKRTLGPIKTLIYGLRRYDVARVAALSEWSVPDPKVEGYMSHKSKIDLADVHDHIEYILTTLDMFAGSSENLINYTFNMSSYEINEVMRQLTKATMIFLPLTLLTGYFGMNFDPMWSVQKNSDILFWEIVIPVMLIVVPFFIWKDLMDMVHRMKKKQGKKQGKKKMD